MILYVLVFVAGVLLGGCFIKNYLLWCLEHYKNCNSIDITQMSWDTDETGQARFRSFGGNLIIKYGKKKAKVLKVYNFKLKYQKHTFDNFNIKRVKDYRSQGL
ncbi:MAG: hypothetical protein IJ094_12920 [Bacilli bacterium]|nr:hypothetical protein [Bacilli bacterium]